MPPVPTIESIDLGFESMLWLRLLVQMLPFLIFYVIGHLAFDAYIDKTAQKKSGDPGAYELEWNEVFYYGVGGSLLTILMLGDLPEKNIPLAAFSAWIMGVVFRLILPEIIKLAEEKFKAIMEVVFK